MFGSKRSKGLGIGYRISYRLRVVGLTLFGPAQLGEQNDPRRALERERAERVARAAAARAAAAREH